MIRLPNSRRINSLFSTLILLLLLTPVAVYSFDWKDLKLAPCNPDTSHPWGEPQEARICGTPHSSMPLLRCDTNCCYSIIYYTRWTGAQNNEFEINIVGIFHDGGENCDSADCYDYVYHIFYGTLLKGKTFYDYDSTFKTKVLSTGRIPTRPDMDSWIYVYNTGKCYSGSSPCTGSRCCRQKFEIGFRDPEKPWICTSFWSGDDWSIEPPCSTKPCNTSKCYEVPSGVNPNTCETMCDKWVEDRQYIVMPFTRCPGCDIRIEFIRNIPEDCSNWKEYKIVSWQKIGNCEPCYSNNLMYLMHEMEYWVLHNGGLQWPPRNTCDTNWRMLKASCWGPDSANPYKMIECPNTFSCCQTVFELCDSSGFKRIREISRSYAPGYCDSSRCWFLCAPVPTIVNPTEVETVENPAGYLNSKVIPNPSTWNNEILIETDFRGIVEIRFVDALSRLISSESVNIRDVTTRVVINNTQFSSGVYYYHILNKGSIIGKGSFNIVK